MKALSELTEREVVALAIANEEEDSRIYQAFADRLRPGFQGLRRSLRRYGGGGAAAPRLPV
jgi:ribosomal protein S12 methylthiotransferase accessory factor YcaO